MLLARLELIRRLGIGFFALEICATVGSARAQTPSVLESGNHAPGIQGFLPRRYDREEVVIKAGTKLELTLLAADPDGDPLVVKAFGLPAGASFNEPLRRLEWSPTPEQTADHVVVFSVTDGHKEATRSLSLKVVRNRAPVFFRRAYTLTVGQFGRIAFAADDADHDELGYRLSNVPPGATFDPVQGLLQWRPTAEAVGRHHFRVSVSDGLTEVTDEFEVEVSAPSEEAWATFLQPGAGASAYLPGEDGVGNFVGGSMRLSLVSWIHRTAAPGPAYGHIYLGAELLASTETDIAPLFGYMLGFDLSFEQNPARRVLIPMYGFEAGGLVHEELGHPFQFTPFLGFVLFAEDWLSVSARGGYRCVPTRFEELSGAHAALMLDGHLW